MPKRSIRRNGRVALAVVALLATLMALYIQILERRARQEADRAAAARLERELAESRVRLRAEVLAQTGTEREQGGSAGRAGDPSLRQPLPNTVLRRDESGAGIALEQALDSREAQRATLLRLEKRLDALALQMEQSDRALREDLTALRASVRRERDLSGKALTLLLAALLPLAVLLLISAWPSRDRE